MNYTAKMTSFLILILILFNATAFAQSGASSFVGFAGLNIDHAIIVPQVVVGQHYTTSLFLLNLGDQGVMTWMLKQGLVTTGRIYFFRQDGTPLKVSVNGGALVSDIIYSLDPSSSINYELSSGGIDTSGWALIHVDEPANGCGWGFMDGQMITGGMRLMANVFYAYAAGQEATSRVGVVPTMYESGQFNTSIIGAQALDDFYTGVAIVNTNSKDMSVALRLRDINGNLIASTQLPLPPGGQVAGFINQLFPASSLSSFRGFLEMNSNDEGIVAMGLLVRRGILTSIPTSHYGQVKITQ